MSETHSVQCLWAPQPGPQHALVGCPYSEIFFGGARGGGKTDGVLGKWAIKEKRYGKAFNAVALRRTTVAFEDAIDRGRQLYLPLGAKYTDKPPRFRMPNGGRIAFGYLENLSDADQQQGKNLTDAWIEEAGQYPSPAPIDRLFGALRSAEGVPIQMILTANPGGAGQHWLSERYGLVPFPDRPKVLTRILPNGAPHKIAVIPSRITDNKIMLHSDPNYINRLQLVGSPALVRAWLEGDWSAIEGAFFPEWGAARQVVEPFEIPDGWLRFRSADWGSARPFSVGWWAVVSDPARMADGRVLPRGALVRYREWYGSSAPNVGLKLPAEEVANGILVREAKEPRNMDGDSDIAYSVMDPATFASDGGPSIAERMARQGVHFHRADNTRIGRLGAMGGWDQVRARLIGGEEGPMIYFFNTCRDSIRTLPSLQHDHLRAEDVDTDSEDHCFVAETLVDTAQGQIAIGDMALLGEVYSTVLKPLPYRNVRITGFSKEVVRLWFEDGRTIVCTPLHNFLVDTNEMRHAKDLEGLEVLCRTQWLSAKRSKSLRASDIIYAAAISSVGASAFMWRFGKAIMAMFRLGITSIIDIADRRTPSPILSAFRSSSIYPGGTASSQPKTLENLSPKQSLRHRFGMPRQKENNGTRIITSGTLETKCASAFLQFASNAAPLIRSIFSSAKCQNGVVATAKRVRCVRVELLSERRDVYCLTVPETGVFSIEGGFLVANSPDEIRYACLSRPYVRDILPIPATKYLADATLDDLWDAQRRVGGGRL